MTTRRDFLKAAGVGAAVLMHANRASSAPEDAARRPNVLFILADDQRGDTVSALGNPHIRTPNLDSLVVNGTVFRRAYCQGGYSPAVCLPARQMILRGSSYFSKPFKDWQSHNFPKGMKEAGYATYVVAKPGNNDGNVLGVFESKHMLNRRGADVPGLEMADTAIKFIRENKKRGDAGRRRPFFMHLGPCHPHDPFTAPKKYLDLYDPAKIPLPANYLPFHPFDNGELFIRDELRAPWPRTADIVRREIRGYYADITCLDEHIGRIFDALKEIGEYENTIIIWMGDQGISNGSHGLLGKQNLYEESMNVPVVFAGPGVPKAKSFDAMTYHFDIYPTVCGLVGAKEPEGIDGRSLLPIMQGGADKLRDNIFLAYRNCQRAVRLGRWKLIRYPQIDRTQLFDLDADPHETKDLAANPAHADRVKELMALLAAEQKRFGDELPLHVKDPKPGDVDLEFFKDRKPQQGKPAAGPAGEK